MTRRTLDHLTYIITWQAAYIFPLRGGSAQWLCQEENGRAEEEERFKSAVTLVLSPNQPDFCLAKQLPRLKGNYVAMLIQFTVSCCMSVRPSSSMAISWRWVRRLGGGMHGLGAAAGGGRWAEGQYYVKAVVTNVK